MTTAYTSLLGLALPVTGELSGTWGDTVNNYITSYTDAAVAGTQTISGSQTAVTLSVTNGSSLTQAGSGSTGSAQYQIINCTGSPASTLTVTVPASSRQYIVINATSTSQSVKIVGAGPTTGVTIVSGEKASVAWNGSDFVKVASTVITNLTGTLAVANGGTGVTTSTGSGSVVLNNTPSLTNPTVTNYTETLYTANTGSALTIALTNGTVQQLTLTANTTLTMPTAAAGKSFIMLLKQDGTGGRTVTWSTVVWPGGTAPTITSTASKQDIYSFFSDGTNWYGVTVGQNY